MRVLRAAAAVLFIALAGCPAVYPELGTRTRPMAPGAQLDPPPPSDLHWIKFVSARIPERTRDGRPWQPNGKASPYAKLLVNGVELIKSGTQSDTLEPTWPEGPHGNFKVAAGDKLRVEVWDSNPLNDKPIAVQELGVVGEVKAFEGKVRVELLEGAAEVVFAFEPAHAVSGLGLWYELRNQGCALTRLLEGSPAERAGLLAGDEVLRIGGHDVSPMTPDQIRSAFNAVPMDGLALVVKHTTGATSDVTLKEGPIYPTFGQFGPID